MAEEYDFSDAIRNPYIQRFQELNLVSLDDDVKAAFPDSKSVNEALRLLIRMSKDAQALQKGQLSLVAKHSHNSHPIGRFYTANLH